MMSTTAATASVTPTPTQGRLFVLLAALMWSTSGAFTKVLTQPTSLELDTPDVEYLQIAFWRVLFAGLVLLPLVRRSDLSWRPLMLAMMACFALMNATFVLALGMGTAANAIVLQYTAPMWMSLACVWLLGEPADRRSLLAFAIGLTGIAVIVWGGWTPEKLPVVGLGLTAGVAYAGVMVCLRVLQSVSSRWLTAINFLASALVLLPWVYHLPLPSGPQLAVLFVYGAVQMAIPYWLVARGVRAISPQEAGTISLIEPLLNPLWTYLIASEVPNATSVIGGAFILGGLAWRYWPLRRK